MGLKIFFEYAAKGRTAAGRVAVVAAAVKGGRVGFRGRLVSMSTFRTIGH